jgi:hypothetical protein
LGDGLYGVFARLTAAFVGLFLLVGCTGPQTMALLDKPGVLPARAEITDVPFFPQQRYYCGPAALATALAWTGLAVTADDMVPQVYTPGKKGTHTNDMIAAARRNGRLAVRLDGLQSVLGEIASGNPVLVFQNLSLDLFPQWHFALAVGYDLDRRTIILRSGTERRRITGLDRFEHTWARGNHWALVVVPPDRIPSTASEPAVLKAAAGLERTGRQEAAASAYDLIAQRWPDSLPALIGFGNARYASGDLPEAERAFRQATERHPDAASAWNNLAYVLGRNGRQKEAIAAARRAIHLAGPKAAPYFETLHELQEITN